MSEINYLVGKKNLKSSFLKPYSKIIIDFLDEFSKNLKKTPNISQYPDLLYLSFWCRKQNLENLRKDFYEKNKKIKTGIGLIFHITPSNVPTNFAYSLIFGLLTGNSNIVKAPSKKFFQIDCICDVINFLLKKKKFIFLNQLIQILRYSNKDNLTKQFSEICDVRMIWGGNKTIDEIKKFKTKSRTLDIPFSDRFSMCVINLDKLKNLNESKLKNLFKDFFNDTYLVDQNACSSPYLIAWYGKNKNYKNLFWKKFSIYLKNKYLIPEIGVMDKYTKLHEDIINLKSFKSYKIVDKNIYLVNLAKIDSSICKLRSKWGYFYQLEINNLKDIFKISNKDFQTLTYFGFEKSYIEKKLINLNLSGIDRIVPIGRSLEINMLWDGYDLNNLLTKVTDLK